MRHLEARVAHLACLLTEDRAQEALLRRQLGLTLGRDLADEDVARADLGADADDAALVEVLEDVLGEVRDVTGDLLGTELGVAGVDLVLLDVDRGEHVVAARAARDSTIASSKLWPFHGMNATSRFLPERELTLVRRRAVGEHVALLHDVAFGDDRLLVDAGALVRAAELRAAGTTSCRASCSRRSRCRRRRRRPCRRPRRARTSPASRAARASMPVPMNGAVVGSRSAPCAASERRSVLASWPARSSARLAELHRSLIHSTSFTVRAGLPLQRKGDE